MANLLIETTLFWLAAALVFELFLKKLTTHAANRAWLVSMALAGLAWPFLKGKAAALFAGGFLPVVQLPVVEVGGAGVPDGSPVGAAGGFWLAVGVVWAAGFLVKTVAIALGLAQVFSQKRRGRVERLPGGFVLVRAEGLARPFSFFRMVFIDNSLSLNGLDAQQVVAHERAHGRLGHSFDLLLMEAIGAFWWFHPLAHWFKWRLREVHEFEADAAVATLFSRKEYGSLLIRSLPGRGGRGVAAALANSFFSSSIKTRIAMLMRQKSAPMAALNYLLALPVGLGLLVFRQGELSAQAANSYPKFAEVAATDTVVTFDPATNIETVEFVRSTVEKEAADSDPNGYYKMVDEMPEFPGGMAALVKFLGENIRYPNEARKAGIAGTVLVSFVVEKDGSLCCFKEVKSPAPALYQSALETCQKMPRWKPGNIGGKPVRVQFNLPVKYKLE